VGVKTDCNHYRGISTFSTTYEMLSTNVSVNFDPTDQLMFLYSTFFRYLRIKKKHNEAVHQLVINIEKTHYSFSSVVFYTTVNVFGIHVILVRITKLYLNEIYCRYYLRKCCLTCSLLRFFKKEIFYRHCFPSLL